MSETKDTKEKVEKVEKKDVAEKTTPEKAAPESTAKTTETPKEQNRNSNGNSRGGFNPQGRPQREFKKNRRTPRRGGRPRSEFEQKILDIRRVTRVSAGGRRFSFSVAVVIGNKRGKIGVGTGKAGDTSFAIQKAVKNAENNTIDVKMTRNSSIPHQVEAKYNSARVLIIPAKGRGVIAGSALRDIMELGGLKDINGKILSGSKNKLNIARATIKALSEIDKIVKDDDKNLKPKPKESPKGNFGSRVRRAFKKK